LDIEDLRARRLFPCESTGFQHRKSTIFRCRAFNFSGRLFRFLFRSYRMRILLCAAAAFLLTGFSVSAQEKSGPKADFSIVDGDHVVFYGDSITEQRLYTTDIENFILTRYPTLHVDFFQSGVGSDRVSGGLRGPIDVRLHRDVFDHNPTVVTIMLGMNDGYYRQFDPDYLTSYSQGYRYIVDSIQKEFPKARITLAKPSPYDDVTRATELPGGYNAVLVRYGAFVGDLATEKNLGVADLNTAVVNVLKEAKTEDAPLSITLINDRVHPGPAIHWVMAEAILKAWNATPEVTAVSLSVEHESVVTSNNTAVTDLAIQPNGLTWAQEDRALPLPLGPIDADPQMQLVIRSSDLISALDQETLQVTALSPGTYQLKIDERVVGSFSAEKLDKGVNLALLETPMLEQARRVARDTDLLNQYDLAWFVMNTLPPDEVHPETLKELDEARVKAADRQHRDTMPLTHHFQLIETSTPTQPRPRPPHKKTK
jgi:lysophospholipase L1-like esterase